MSSAAASFVLGAALAATNAYADPVVPELKVHASASWAAIPNLASWRRGPGVAAGVELLLGGIAGIALDAGYNRLLVLGDAPDDATPSSLLTLAAGPALRIDVAKVSPFVALQGVYTADGGVLGDPERPSDHHVGLRASLGLEFAPIEPLRVAVIGDWGAVAPSLLAYPAFVTLRLRVGWTFGRP